MTTFESSQNHIVHSPNMSQTLHKDTQNMYLTLNDTDNVFWEKKVHPSTEFTALSKKNNPLSNRIVCCYYKIHVCTDFHSCNVPVPDSSHAFPCATTVDLKSLCFANTNALLSPDSANFTFQYSQSLSKRGSWRKTLSLLDCVSPQRTVRSRSA